MECCKFAEYLANVRLAKVYTLVFFFFLPRIHIASFGTLSLAHFYRMMLNCIFTSLNLRLLWIWVKIKNSDEIVFLICDVVSVTVTIFLLCPNLLWKLLDPVNQLGLLDIAFQRCIC